MKVVPFRKPNHFASPGGRVRKDDGKFGYPVVDDFSDEIEIIRANESLMATLEARAKQPGPRCRIFQVELARIPHLDAGRGTAI